MSSQIADVRDVVQYALEELRLERLVLLGLRLGATVAALAAETEISVAGLVLWSPIVSGSSYLRELARKKVFAQIAFGEGSLKVSEVLQTLASEGRVEIEGNYLTRAMSTEIEQIDLPRQIRRFRGPVFVSTIEDPRHKYELVESLADAYNNGTNGCNVDIVGSSPFWDRTFLYKHEFPEELYLRTKDWIVARWIAS